MDIDYEKDEFKKIVNYSNSAVFIAEQVTRKIIFANRAWKRLVGIDENQDVTGVSMYDLFSLNDALYNESELDKLPFDHYEEKHVKSLHNQYLHIWGKKILWNNCQAYICYLSDETELWQSRQQLKELIDHIPGGILIYEIDDESVRLVYVNDTYKDKLCDTGIICGKKYIDEVYYEDREIVLSTIGKVRNGSDLFDIQFRLLSNEKKYTWIRLSGEVVKRVDRKITIYCCCTDFDNYMKNQLELQSNRIMLDIAMKSAKVLAWRFNMKTGTIIDSGTLGKKYGLSLVINDIPNSIIKKGYIHDDSIDAYKKMFEEILCKKQVIKDIHMTSKLRGDSIWVRHIYTQIYDDMGNYIESVGTSIDVTDQKEKEFAYNEKIRLRRFLINDAVKVGHFNLTKNELIDSESLEKYIPNEKRNIGMDRVLSVVTDCVGYEMV